MSAQSACAGPKDHPPVRHQKAEAVLPKAAVLSDRVPVRQPMAEPDRWDIPTDLRPKELPLLAEAVPDLKDTWIDHPDLPAEVAPGQPDKPVADPAAQAYLAHVRRRLPWLWPVSPQ